MLERISIKEELIAIYSSWASQTGAAGVRSVRQTWRVWEMWGNVDSFCPDFSVEIRMEKVKRSNSGCQGEMCNILWGENIPAAKKNELH